MEWHSHLNVNKIIGSGGREGVSKGADSKNMDQTNFYKVRSHMNRGQMIAAVSNSLHVIIWCSEDKCTELCNQKYQGQLGCQLQVNLRKIVRQFLKKIEKIFL